MKLAGMKLRAHRLGQTPPLSQGELGGRFGYSAMTISRYETGKADPPLAFMHAVAKAGIAELSDWTIEVGANDGDSAGDTRPEPAQATGA